MADHLRKQIRAAIRTACAAVPGFTLVTSERTAAINADNMPTCLVRTPEERITPKSLGLPRLNERMINAEVSLYLRSNTPLDDIDALALLVEQAMSADITLGGIAKWNQLERVVTDEQATSERPWCRIIHSYTIAVLSLESAPDVLR